MSTRTAKWRELSAMPTSSRGLLGIMKMCSLCRLCGVDRALCPAWPGQVRLTPSDPRNYRIAESPNRRGAHFDRIANREALPNDSARFDQPCSSQALFWGPRSMRARSRPCGHALRSRFRGRDAGPGPKQRAGSERRQRCGPCPCGAA